MCNKGIKLEELEKMSCRQYGGNNCALHQCMFECQLKKKKKEIKDKKDGRS